jgi:hypothetical protein
MTETTGGVSLANSRPIRRSRSTKSAAASAGVQRW